MSGAGVSRVLTITATLTQIGRMGGEQIAGPGPRTARPP
jgi:hypothetical protein